MGFSSFVGVFGQLIYCLLVAATFFFFLLNSCFCCTLTILLFIDSHGLNHNETSWKCYANEPTGSLSSLFSLLSCQIMMSALVPYRHQTTEAVGSSKVVFSNTRTLIYVTFSSSSNPHLGNVGNDVSLCSPEVTQAGAIILGWKPICWKILIDLYH